jgi:hypothetical protein
LRRNTAGIRSVVPKSVKPHVEKLLMLRHLKLLFTAAVAIGLMGAMVSSASAQTVTVRAITTTPSTSVPASTTPF